MNFKIDLFKEGYQMPSTRSEKFYALIGLLNDSRKRHWDSLAEFLGKSTRQIRRDVEKIASLYEVSFDDYGRPYIVGDNPKHKDRIHELVAILASDELKNMDELAAIFHVSTRTIRRDIKMLEKFFDLDYDFENRPFLFSE